MTKKRRRRWPIVVAVVVLAGAAAYAAAVAYVSGDIPPNTTVNGVQIGGMTTAQAAVKLQEELGKEAKAPIPVTAVESSMEIKPAKSGLSVDWEATAAQASGTVLNPAELVDYLTGSVELEPVVVVDQEELEKSLVSLAAVADTLPVEPDIQFTKKAQARLVDGRDGQAVDVQTSAELVAEAYMDPTAGELALPVTTTAPAVSNEDAENELNSFAKPAVAADVTVIVTKEKDVTLSPVDLSRNLSYTITKGKLVPQIDGKGLHLALANQLQGVEQPDKDATFKFVNDKPVIVPSKDGVAIDNEDLGKAVMAVLPETDPDKRAATVRVTRKPAKFTTADAKALNITEKLSSFRQDFEPAAYRYQNVGQAAKYMNGTILKPGDIYSMNDTVKERTRENGYTEGFIIANGVFREELGGGVSIITTATWTAAFYAGLERIEQRAHGLYISRYTAGLEATVAWGYLDLKFRNDTGNGVLIQAVRYNDGVRITMWGKKKYDKVTATFSERNSYTNYETIYDESPGCVPSTGSRGFSISVTRRLIKDGKTMRTETFPTTYKPTPNVICRAKPTTE